MKEVLIFFSLLCLKTTTLAQKSQQIFLPKGARYEMTSESSSIMKQVAMGQTMHMKVTTQGIREFAVLGYEQNDFLIEHKLKAVKYEMTVPVLGKDSFDSEKTSNKESKEVKQIRKSLQNDYRLVVSPQGKVRKVYVAGSLVALKDSASFMTEVLREFIPGLVPPHEGESFDLTIFAPGLLQPGFNWTDSSVNNKGAKTIVAYTVISQSDSGQLVKFLETRFDVRKMKQDNFDFAIEARDSTTGQILFSTESKILQSRKATTISSGSTIMMGQSNPYTRQTESMITVRRIE